MDLTRLPNDYIICDGQSKFKANVACCSHPQYISASAHWEADLRKQQQHATTVQCKKQQKQCAH